MSSAENMFDIHDERELFFFLNMAITKSLDINTKRWGTSMDGLKQAVTACFKENDRYQFSSTSLSIKRRANLLGERYFTWLHNPDACFFTWVYVNHHESSKLQYSDTFKIWGKTFRLIYGAPDSHAQRYYSVVGYFDCLEDSPENKIEIINSINRKWNVRQVKDKYNRWIDSSDKALCEWIWNVLLSEGIASPDIAIKNHDEIYYAVMAIFQAWPAEPKRPEEINKAGVHLLSREASLTKLHKTWMQKKYREKLRSDDLSLPQPVRKKLHFIQRKMGVSPEEIITEFIERTYLTIKKNV